MDYTEFSTLTESTVRALLPRIPAKYHHGFEAALVGGELRMTVEGLMQTLVEDRVPITASEREDLRRMLAYLNVSSSQLEHLHVAEVTES